MHFNDRKHAGLLLAKKVSNLVLDKKNTVVLAIPRGGVPIANEIAKILGLPLDIILVKKIGAPSYPELAIGSVTENDEHVYNEDLLLELGYKHSDLEATKEIALIKLQEIARFLRQGSPPLPLAQKDIIVVDDGIATGATIESVIQFLKKRKVRKIIIATPVASAETLIKIRKMVDETVVLSTPNPIYSVGEWYENFIQVENEEVINILNSNSGVKNKKIKKMINTNNNNNSEII